MNRPVLLSLGLFVVLMVPASIAEPENRYLTIRDVMDAADAHGAVLEAYGPIAVIDFEQVLLEYGDRPVWLPAPNGTKPPEITGVCLDEGRYNGAKAAYWVQQQPLRVGLAVPGRVLGPGQIDASTGYYVQATIVYEGLKPESSCTLL